MSYDQKVMDRCIFHALKNPIESRGRNTISRMAALIRGNNVIEYQGWNRYKSHPMMLKFSNDHEKICLHAEIDALIRLLRNFHSVGEKLLTDIPFDCYVARVLKNGTPALAKPCDTCFGALTYFGIRNIYWTT